jgi:alkyl hydroperoxide reductase subunit AhpC
MVFLEWMHGGHKQIRLLSLDGIWRERGHIVTGLSPTRDCFVMPQCLVWKSMATLSLETPLEHLQPQGLAAWLGGDWCLMFSHPRDFQAQVTGKRRGLDSLRQQLRARALKIVGIQPSGSFESSWIDELHGDQRILWLPQVSGLVTDDLSTAAALLRDEILAMPTRFVLFVDAALRSREVLQYSAGRDFVSISDLLLTVDMLRARPAFTRSTSTYGGARLPLR